ncbi:MLP-like protein 34 [Prosopis cineraria]|uniref:MLP-like protein 34 n=1 Tax=Prosopis cineraria TaxID=364024 RepID=UPI00240E9F07|nr:MLP-like protein 34 [Prosopis cineraria]
MAQLAGKLEGEVEVNSPAAEFFGVLASQLHHVKNISDVVHETKVHQGDWHGVGSASIKHWTYTVVEKCKEHFEEIDHENKSLAFNLFDGDVGDKYKSLKAKLQVTDKGNGALAKWTYEYEKLREEVPPPQAYLDFATKVTKDVDAHLMNAKP